MTYNVQNLGRPQKGIEESISIERLEALKKTINKNSNKQGPDLIFLQEVSDYRAVKSWLAKNWKNKSYNFSAKPKSGKLLLPFIASTYKFIDLPVYAPIKNNKSSLYGRFLKGRVQISKGLGLDILNVHMPSAGSSLIMRKENLRQLAYILNHDYKNSNIIVAGDFNITSRELPKVEEEINLIQKNYEFVHHKLNRSIGTFYYHHDKMWSFLDWIIVNTSLLSGKKGYQLDVDKSYVGNKFEGQITKDGYPYKFQYKDKKGVSDHFPLLATYCKKS